MSRFAPRFAKLFAANAIAAAGLGSAALALSAPAAAEPMLPPAVPGVPALNMIQQFATNPASVGAVLQTAATALNGASSLVGAPAPNTLPISPIEGVPGYPAPAAPYTPVAAPLPAAPVPGPAQMVGPLLSQLGVPANLVGLAPAGLPLVGPTQPVAPVAPVAPIAAPLPVAPVAPAIPVSPNPLLNALP
jgi:hypothetical protein